MLGVASDEQVSSLREQFSQCVDEFCAYVEAAVLQQLQPTALLASEPADTRALDALAICAAAFPESRAVHVVSAKLLTCCVESLVRLEAGPHTIEAQFAKNRAVSVVAAVHTAGALGASAPSAGRGSDTGLVAALLHSTCRASAQRTIGGKEWNTLAASHAQTKWECLADLLKFPCSGVEYAGWLGGGHEGTAVNKTTSGYAVDVAAAVECLEEALEVCTAAYLVPILRSLRAMLLPHLHGIWISNAGQDDRVGLLFTEIARVLRPAWSAFSECRKKSPELVSVMLALIFPEELCCGLASCAGLHGADGILRQYFEQFRTLGLQQRPMLMQLLVVHLCSIWKQHPAGAVLYADELVELCLYKEPLFKQIGCGGVHIDSERSARSFTRVAVNTFFDSLPVPAPPAMQTFLDGIIVQLLDLSLIPSYAGPVSAGGVVFGRKLRSWQTLCLLSRHVHDGILPEVNARLWNVVRQANLNAIAHYIELFAARMVTRFPLLLVRQHVLSELNDVTIPGHASASLGLILGVALPHLMTDEFTELRRAIVTSMLPWLSCDTGHARTIAQCVVSQLLPAVLRQQQNAAGTQEASSRDHAFLCATLGMLQQNKEIVRMLNSQQRYFARTDPERECSLEALLASPLSDFNEIEPVALVGCIKDAMKSVHKQLTEEHIELVGGPRNQLSTAADKNVVVNASTADVQRKVDPWAALQAALQQSSDAGGAGGRASLLSAGRKRQPLLVCASLVDKVPNLAGLARTCEIFGAEGLTIPSMKTLAHPLFTQISVTAEKWVPISEVKEDGVRPYLLRCKRAGYTVVGVEQTANSTSLLDYKFPDKTVLVLGKEREGIPMTILQDVDQCVEIPQLGLIRSLNVHVTGALMIWQYTQQKLLAQRQNSGSSKR